FSRKDKEYELGTILDYLGSDPIFLWDDLLAIEDNYVALKQMPAFHSPFLDSLHDCLKKIGKKAQHIFFSSQWIEELSSIEKKGKKGRFLESVSFEMFQESFTAFRFFHT